MKILLLKIRLFIKCYKLAKRSGKGIKTAIAVYREQMQAACRVVQGSEDLHGPCRKDVEEFAAAVKGDGGIDALAHVVGIERIERIEGESDEELQARIDELRKEFESLKEKDNES